MKESFSSAPFARPPEGEGVAGRGARLSNETRERPAFLTKSPSRKI